MRHIRKLLALIPLSLSFVTLASCHNNIKNNNWKNSDFEVSYDDSKHYKISFWAKNDGNSEQIKVYDDAIAKFNTYYPNITIEKRNFTSYDDIYRDVLINIGTNTTPNVCISYPDNVATYLAGNDIVLSLDDIMNDKDYGFGGKKIKYESIKKEELIEKFFDEGKINNRYYTLPFMRSTEALYINKDYVEKLGMTIPDIPTWDYIWEVCQKAVDAKKEELIENPSADKILYPLIYKSSDNWFITYAKQKNIPYTSNNGEVLMFNDKTTEALLDLNEKYNAGLFSTFKKVSYPGNSFNKWECLFAIDSTAGATWIGNGATSHDAGNTSEQEEFETVVKMIPQVDTNNPTMISQGPSICLFKKDNPDEVVASWLFAQFLLTNEVQLGYSHTEGYLPVTNKAIDSEEFTNYLNSTTEYKVKLDATKLVMDNINNTFITPVFNGSANARLAATYILEGSTKKKVLSKEAIEELYDKAIKQNGLADLMNVKSNKIRTESIVLIIVLCSTWVLMLGSFIAKIIINKRREKM